MKIDRNTIINEILLEAPEKVHILTEAGMHCIGCMISEFETLEEACSVHDIDVDDLIEELNKEDIEINYDTTNDFE